MEAEKPDTAHPDRPLPEPTTEPRSGPPSGPGGPAHGDIDRAGQHTDHAQDAGPQDSDHLVGRQQGEVAWVDADWAKPDPDDPLAAVTDAIERLTQLDPADAAAPGTTIADILSRALEEEER